MPEEGVEEHRAEPGMIRQPIDEQRLASLELLDLVDEVAVKGRTEQVTPKGTKAQHVEVLMQTSRYLLLLFKDGAIEIRGLQSRRGFEGYHVGGTCGSRLFATRIPIARSWPS